MTFAKIFLMIQLNTIQKLVLVSLLFLISFGFTKAQNTCSEDLKHAVSLYENGRYDDAIQLLTERLKTCDFSKAEREQALKTLSSAYFYLDEIELGNESILKLLKKSPNYKVNPSFDPQPFVEAYPNYDIRPAFSVGFEIGMGHLFPAIEKTYQVWDTLNYNQPYVSETRPRYGLFAQIYFSDKFAVRFGPDLLTGNYGRNIALSDNLTIYYQENVSWLIAPFSIRYLPYNNKKIYPELFIGAYNSTLITYESEIFYYYFTTDEQTGEPVRNQTELVDFYTKDHRRINNQGVFGGLTLNYKQNRIVAFASVKFATNLKNYTLPQKRYNNQTLIFDYYYINDDFKFRTMNFSVGVAYILKYRIRKKY